MYRILTASKDTYITNKIINSSFRATDANVGQAASLDLFKLYDESTLSTETEFPTEVSRLLVKFDLDPLRSLTGSFLDIGDSSFSCKMRLTDIYGGQTCPSNFKIIVFPLSKSFDEGVGRDIVTFSDLDSCNFITSSVINDGVTAWEITGANKQGFLGSSNIDIISSGTLSGSSSTENVNLWVSQKFPTGEEDLLVDVTTVISATLKNLIPDHGFRISFSGSQETDKTTRFVKRFASVQHSDPYKRPSLLITFNDSIQDHHDSFYFNISGSLFLNNFHRGTPRNILSGSTSGGSGLAQVTGSNCIAIRLTTGSSGDSTLFSKVVTGSQHSYGQNFASGVYSASFAISQWESSALRQEIKNAASATFNEIWQSLDGTIGYHTGSLVIKSVNRTSFDNDVPTILLSVTNMRDKYRKQDKVRFRVFAENVDRPVKAKRLPFKTQSEIFPDLYYRIKNVESGDIIIPFEKEKSSTLCSTDSDGMYFDFYMSSLHKGGLFVIEFLLKDHGTDQIFTDVSTKFKVI